MNRRGSVRNMGKGRESEEKDKTQKNKGIGRNEGREKIKGDKRERRIEGSTL